MKARYKTLVDQYAHDIRAGNIPAGTRLPTHRALAASAHISLATATRVYAELDAMGLVSGETGRGTFVRETALPAGHGIDQQRVSGDVLDLNFNYPSLPEQGELLRRALRALALTGDIDTHLRYQPHSGRLSDRGLIARHLTRPPFVPDADDLLIVNGAQHGLAVTVMGLLRPGDVVAVDALTYSGFKALAALSHIELVAIPCCATGPDLDALITLCQRRHIRAVYTMPTLHNPLGWVFTHQQRQDLAAIARQYDLLIIEDAAYAYLVDNPPPPVAVYAPERTVYITGFSKNVATGFRVGVVICPPGYRSALERAIRATVWHTPSLLTAILCTWLQDGTVARLEALKRQDATERQSIARAVLGELAYLSHPSSYFIWIPLKDESRADRVVQALLKQHISVSTAAPFCTSSHGPQAIRVALGSVSLPVLGPALMQVKEAIELELYR